jgi:SAM-dependent methyltransferase
MSARPPDPDGLRYQRYWEPVLTPPGQRLLDRLDVEPSVLLDLGAGTGSLAFAAADRWSTAAIIGLDASGAMLSVARHRALVGPAGAADRFTWLAADSAAIPLDAASVDLVMSGFMLQLVDDRSAVLGEVRRVLRPGGVLALVTWTGDELQMAADDAFDAVVLELGLDEPLEGAAEPRSTDYRSVDEAASELLAAGFVEVDARADLLHHAWTREEYLRFKRCFDELELYEALEPGQRDRLEAEVQRRWSDLPGSAFELHGTLVSAVARKPAG